MLETVCVHGDNPTAAQATRELRQALEREEISVVPLAQIVRELVRRKRLCVMCVF